MKIRSKDSDKVEGPSAESAKGRRFGIAVGGYHREIGERLLEGARQTLFRYGAKRTAIEEFWVPGCFELPLVLKKLAATRRFDALLALGVVIRGGTPHFEYVAGEASRGIAQVAYDFGLPVGFGVLTTEDLRQAHERAGGKIGNKGEEAALAVLHLLDLLRRI